MPVGKIVKALSGFYYVQTEDGIITCRGRGKLRRGDIAPLVGDNVEISLDGDKKGSVEKILERKNSFVRPSVSNIDVLIAVAAEVNPITEPWLIDRVTTMAEYKNCEVIICVNKADMSENNRLYDIYSKTGYKTIKTSALTYEGIEELREEIRGKTCAFSGNSGVGKSSLLNALDGELCLAVGEVSEKLGRGRHTTRHVELFPVGDAFVMDTPGFASFDVEMMTPIPKEDLDACFPEFREYLGTCKFQDCAHKREPDCAVRQAMEDGKISKTRYESYLKLYEISAQYKAWENK